MSHKILILHKCNINNPPKRSLNILYYLEEKTAQSQSSSDFLIMKHQVLVKIFSAKKLFTTFWTSLQILLPPFFLLKGIASSVLMLHTSLNY
jgi:hypothetical protein